MNQSLNKIKLKLGDSFLGSGTILAGGGLFQVAYGFLFWLIVSLFYSTNDIGLAISFLTLGRWAAMLARGGFEDAVRRETASVQRIRGVIITPILRKIAIRGLLISILIGFLYRELILEHFDLYHVLIISSILIFFYNSDQLLDSISIGLKKSKYVLIKSNIQGLFKFVFCIIFIQYEFLGIVFSVILSGILGSSYQFSALLKNQIISDENIELKTKLKELSNYSKNIFVSNIFLNVPAGLLPTLILLLSNEEIAGKFAIIYMITNMLLIFPNAYGQTIMVEISNNDSNGIIQLKQNRKILFAIILIPPLLISSLAVPILMLFSINSKETVGLFVLLSLSVIPSSFINIQYNIWRARSNLKTLNLFSIINSLMILVSPLVYIYNSSLVLIGVSHFIVYLMSWVIMFTKQTKYQLYT